MMIRLIKKLLILLIFVLVVLFSISNKDYISIGILPLENRLEIPVFLFSILLIFVGLIIGIVLTKISNIFSNKWLINIFLESFG